MTQIEQTQRDPMVRYLDDFMPAPGQSRLDVARRAPGSGISRSYGHHRHAITSRVSVPEGWIICKGAACGVCEDGKTRPIRPEYAPQKFTGFAAGTGEGDVLEVISRGQVLVRIDGLTPQTDRHVSVYVTGPDSFSLTPEGPEAGILLGIQPENPEWGVVAFKAWNDPKPFDLGIRER